MSSWIYSEPKRFKLIECCRGGRALSADGGPGARRARVPRVAAHRLRRVRAAAEETLLAQRRRPAAPLWRRRAHPVRVQHDPHQGNQRPTSLSVHLSLSISFAYISLSIYGQRQLFLLSLLLLLLLFKEQRRT